VADEKMVQKSYRLPAGDVEMIERLADNQILGANSSAVVRTIISAALKELVQTEYVKKHKKTMELLSKK
jgi:uncharacterized membrane protein